MTCKHRAPRRLVIAGDTLHYIDDQGLLNTHAALAAQIDTWAKHFDQVRFCGVQETGRPPPGFAPYNATNITLVPLRRAGGKGVRSKTALVAAMVFWLNTLRRELRSATAVHLRTPCNVTIPAIVLARMLVPNRYAIYAGSWDAYSDEPTSYRFQRWLLRRVFGGVVHAYLAQPSSTIGTNLRAGFSPVLTEERLDELAATARLERLAQQLPVAQRPIRLVSVGRFSPNKNQVTLIRAVRILQDSGVPVECHLIGDGSELDTVKLEATGLVGVTFTSHASRDEVFTTMMWADLNILPSFREGFPKVLVEGMSVGALPVASNTPMNRRMVATRGWTIDPSSPEDLAIQIHRAIAMTNQDWAERRASCHTYARKYNLDAFEVEVDNIVNDIWAC